MSIWDVDAEPVPRVLSRVQNELYRLEDYPEFKVLTKENDAIKFKFDGGIIEIGLPDVNEYSSTTLVEEIVILRLLYVDKKRRGEGIGTRILKTILEAYEDSSAAIVIYPIPVQLAAWSLEPQMVQKLSLQKKLIKWYERLGFKCLCYNKIYNIRYLLELMHRYSFKKLTPSAMAITFKNTSGEVRDELKRCTVTSAEMFKDVKEAQHVPELSPFDLLSGRFVV